MRLSLLMAFCIYIMSVSSLVQAGTSFRSLSTDSIVPAINFKSAKPGNLVIPIADEENDEVAPRRRIYSEEDNSSSFSKIKGKSKQAIQYIKKKLKTNDSLKIDYAGQIENQLSVKQPAHKKKEVAVQPQPEATRSSNLVLPGRRKINNSATVQQVDSAPISDSLSDSNEYSYSNAANSFENSITELILPPLDSLIDIAIQNSPAIKSSIASTEQAKYITQHARREWQKDVTFNLSYFDGNQNNAVYSASPDVLQSSLVANGYRVGVNFIVPILYELSGRSVRIKNYQAEAENRRYKTEEIKQDIGLRVIHGYNATMACHKILQIKSFARANILIYVQMAERDFKEGTGTLNELARISDLYNKAQIDYELAKQEYYTNYEQLERIVGIKFSHK